MKRFSEEQERARLRLEATAMLPWSDPARRQACYAATDSLWSIMTESERGFAAAWGVVCFVAWSLETYP